MGATRRPSHPVSTWRPWCGFWWRRGADVNARDEDGQTALTLLNTAADGYEATLRYLVASGADVNARSVDGTTALENARRDGRDEAVRFLRRMVRGLDAACRG